MAEGAASASSSPSELDGSDWGWVEARTSCDHLPPSLSSHLSQIPTPDSPCARCGHPSENWVCLTCKSVCCSRFINKHMLEHYQESGHCIVLSYSDLSVWCFSCDAYLDAQAILQLRPAYEIVHLLKFGERPPFQTVESLQLCDGKAEVSSSGS